MVKVKDSVQDLPKLGGIFQMGVLSREQAVWAIEH